MQEHGRYLRRSVAMLVLAAFVCLALVTVAMAVADTTAPVVTNVVPANGSTIFTNGGSTIYYQLGNTTPLVIKADYTDEAGGSGVDPTSVMVHLDVSNMLMNCPVQTATHVECAATAADLTPGTHSIDVYVADLAGNLTVNRTYVNVVVDSVVPSYANLSPVNGSTIHTSQLNSASANDMSALRIDYDIIDPAPSSGVNPMSHINDSFPPGGAMGAMISNASCVKTPDANNPTHYSCQVNRAKLLHLGDNTLSVLLKDRVGNNNYTDPTSVNHYTVVDDVAPAISGVAANSVSIGANYNDPAPTNALSTSLTSGINVASAMVHVDGMMIMSGCTATATGINCATPSLAPGVHTALIIVADNAGNASTATASFCVSGKPVVGIRTINAFWGSYADYTARELSVRLRFTNGGPNDAFGLAMTGSTNNNGVTLSTAMPLPIGDLANGASADAIAKYNVPLGVRGFNANITGAASDACGTSYTYPV